MGSSPSAAAVIAERVASVGPIRFDEYVDLALYHPDVGFYAKGGGAGRRRDFITSPEVGPLFGAVVARVLDAWWNDRGVPDRFCVVEAGAGPGTLARSIRAAGPASRDALELTLVERSAALRALHPDGTASRLSLPSPGELSPGPTVIVANELLDNLPFRLVERVTGGWGEVRVTDGDVAGRFAEVIDALPEEDARRADHLVPNAPIGVRIPLQDEAERWLADAIALAGPGGAVIVFDYASSSAHLAERSWTEWARTYAGHALGGHPLEHPGEQDITCEVAVDQLAGVLPPAANVAQADWLHAHGIDELVDEGRRIWLERASIGDLAAVRARSRINEAEALLDPTGLGAFRVLEWKP